MPAASVAVSAPVPLAPEVPRYLVVLPTAMKPVGGVNILLWMVETLQAAGHPAAVLVGRPDYAYAFRDFAGEVLYSPDLAALLSRPLYPQGVLRRLMRRIERLRAWRPFARAVNPTWVPRAQDVVILPEFNYPEARAAFAGHKAILAVQDVFGLLRARLRTAAPAPGDFAAVFATSEACAAAAHAVFATPPQSFRLPVAQESLRFNPEKTPQIAMMPRKRRQEAAMLRMLIAAHPDLRDLPVVVIDKMPAAEAHRLLRESLFFVSLSDQDGFGLPPAEAMATGSLVVGFTGVGGEEFFRPDLADPIPDSDVVGLVERLAERAAQWRADPAALEARRRAASDFIWSRYDADHARDSFLQLWAGIDRALRG